MKKLIGILKLKKTWFVIVAVASLFGAPPQVTNKVLSVVTAIAAPADNTEQPEQ